MLPLPLTAEQQQQAKLLEAKIRLAVEQEIAALARLLVSKADDELFGRTEFQVRDLVLRMGAKAFQEYLGENKLGWQTWAESRDPIEEGDGGE